MMSVRLLLHVTNTRANQHQSSHLSSIAGEHHSRDLNPGHLNPELALKHHAIFKHFLLILSHASQSLSSLACHTWTVVIGPTRPPYLRSPFSSHLSVLPETADWPKTLLLSAGNVSGSNKPCLCLAWNPTVASGPPLTVPPVLSTRWLSWGSSWSGEGSLSSVGAAEPAQCLAECARVVSQRRQL